VRLKAANAENKRSRVPSDFAHINRLRRASMCFHRSRDKPARFVGLTFTRFGGKSWRSPECCGRYKRHDSHGVFERHQNYPCDETIAETLRLGFYSITNWAFFAIFRGWRGSFAKFSDPLPACLDLCGLEVIGSVPSGLFAPMRQP
jgi:hypothetical protein